MIHQAPVSYLSYKLLVFHESMCAHAIIWTKKRNVFLVNEILWKDFSSLKKINSKSVLSNEKIHSYFEKLTSFLSLGKVILRRSFKKWKKSLDFSVSRNSHLNLANWPTDSNNEWTVLMRTKREQQRKREREWVDFIVLDFTA